MTLEAQARAIQSKVQKNLNFAIARGLTNTAKFASQKMQQQLPAIFDRPTPFTQRAIGFQPAAKAKLEARVFVRDVQAQYLMRQEQGENAIGPESRAITLRLFETYMEEGSDIPVNVFVDGVRATIDEEEWEGRTAILSVFWLSKEGAILEREQIAIREMDAMPLEIDQNGNPMRSLILEEPDITQREIEGKTSNAEFQALIDPTDKAFEHVGTTQSQKINFGKVADKTVK